MARNVGPEDRVVRIVVGLAVGFLIYLGVIAVYLLLTGILVRDPFYKMLDIDTSIQEQSYSTTDDRSGL